MSKNIENDTNDKNKKRSSIDEKIQEMEDWMKKYPLAKICIVEINYDVLKTYSKSDEEFEELKKEYQKMIKNYEYARVRKSSGKLKPQQIIRCKDANIGGVFGYTCRVDDIAHTYGMDPKTTNYLLSKYGSIDKFVRLFREKKLKGRDLKYAKGTIKQALDLDRDKRSSNYDYLVASVFKEYNSELLLYSSKDLKEIMKSLKPTEKEVLEYRYGLESGQRLTLDKCSEELNLSMERVRQIDAAVIRKLRVYINKSNIIYNSIYNNKFISAEEKERIRNFFDKIKSSNAIFYTVKDPNIDELYWDRETEFLKELRIRLRERQETKRKKSSKASDLDISIDKLKLSKRSLNALNRSGIHTLEQLINITGKEFFEIKGIGLDSVQEVVDKLIDLGLCFKPEEFSKLQRIRRKRDKMQRIADSIIKRAENAKKLSDKIDEMNLQNEKKEEEK